MMFDEDTPEKALATGGAPLQFYKTNENEYVMRGQSLEWLREEQGSNEAILSLYNTTTDTYTNTHLIAGKKYARRTIDGRLVGGVTVPYTAQQFLEYDPGSGTFWLLWAESQTIAQLNTDFDTLQTVSIDLPREDVGSERDSILAQYERSEYKEMPRLLSEKKVAVQGMRIDHRNRFWLKLSYASPDEQWLIVDDAGEPQKIVRLPKNSMLMHVSPHHVGVRLNNNTFGLFEPVH